MAERQEYQSTHTGQEIDAAVDRATLVVANPNDTPDTTLTKINIANTIYSIAGSGGVSSIGNATGDISLGDRLEINNNEINAKDSIGQYTLATPTSNISNGDCYYNIYNDIVILTFLDVLVKSGTSSNGAILFENIPKAKQGLVFVLYAYETGNGSAPIRVSLNTDGTIKTHYSSTASFGSSGNHHYGQIVYVRDNT